MLVSIITVNFNAGELLTQSILSVFASTVEVEVLIADNASKDDSIEHLINTVHDERLFIHKNNANIGFAKANNQLIPKAKGDYLLFLNPDCIIQPDTLQRMIEVMKDKPEVGMAGCLIKNADHTEQAGCRRRVPTPWRTMVRILRLNKLFKDNPKFQCISLIDTPLPKSPVLLEAISGAFMLVKREALNDVGLMDESYFLHCEDLDWFMQFRKKGWDILFIPDIEVIHHKGHCSKDIPIRVEWYKHAGMTHFYQKHFRHQYSLPLMILVKIAIWIRFSVISVALMLKKK
jgi:GT2 family glycosyltransferase